MIFIFGTRGTTGQPIQTSQNCPACGKEHSIYMVPSQRYFHLFWIPLFPTSKQFIPACSSCGAVFTTQKIPVTNEVRSQYKTPKWTFFGLFLFAFLILAIIVSVTIGSVTNGSDMKSKIENAQAGDVYQIKYNNKEYSLMKAVSATTDSVYFYMSPAKIEKRGLDKLMEIDTYDTLEKRGFSKKELSDNSINGFEILKIKR